MCPTAKVGKTSLIMSLVGEEFPEEVCAITAVSGWMFISRKIRGWKSGVTVVVVKLYHCTPVYLY